MVKKLISVTLWEKTQVIGLDGKIRFIKAKSWIKVLKEDIEN